MLQNGWTLKHAVKDASHERPPIVWVHLYELSRIGKSMESESR